MPLSPFPAAPFPSVSTPLLTPSSKLYIPKSNMRIPFFLLLSLFSVILLVSAEACSNGVKACGAFTSVSCSGKCTACTDGKCVRMNGMCALQLSLAAPLQYLENLLIKIYIKKRHVQTATATAIKLHVVLYRKFPLNYESSAT